MLNDEPLRCWLTERVTGVNRNQLSLVVTTLPFPADVHWNRHDGISSSQEVTGLRVSQHGTKEHRPVPFRLTLDTPDRLRNPARVGKRTYRTRYPRMESSASASSVKDR